MNAANYDIRVIVIMGAVGGIALLPFTYFARKAVQARRELKGLKTARIKGEISE